MKAVWTYRRPAGWRVVWAAVLSALVASPGARADEARVALVVGVAKYSHVNPLPNPTNDARLIAGALRSVGFDVSEVLDPDYETLKTAIRHFGERIETAQVALFYYAGHGLQVAGHNYLLPTSTNIAREADLRFEAFDMDDILQQMDAPGRVNLIFLDACRDNPFSRSLAAHLGARGDVVGQGLAETRAAASGTLIAYATDPGNIAQDGAGADSPFSEALARHLPDPGLEVQQILTRVRADVRRATNSGQRPWVSSNLDADFYFVPTPAAAVPAPSAPAPAPPQPPVAVATREPDPPAASAEVVFWQSIATSTRKEDFEAYLAQFPHGVFAPLARNRVALLTPPAGPVAPTTAPAQTAPEDDAAWPLDDRRAILAALVGLGQLKSPGDGSLDDTARAAILRWQAYSGLDESGHLTGATRARLLADARAVSDQLRVGARSPRGTDAASVRGGQVRFELGAAFEAGDDKPRDTAEAAFWYALAAADGYPAAYTNLGTLRARGGGAAKPDLTTAALLWRVGVALGDGTAAYDLGVMFERGLGTAPDLSTARRWYGRGADRKHEASAASLRRLGG